MKTMTTVERNEQDEHRALPKPDTLLAAPLILIAEEHPAIQSSLLDYALGLVGLKAGAEMNVAGLPIQVKEILRGVAPLLLYGDGKALARMEWVPLEDTIGDDDDATSSTE